MKTTAIVLLTALAASFSFAGPDTPPADPAPAPAKEAKPAGNRVELIFPEAISEAPSIFQSIQKQEPVKSARVTHAELLKAFDAAKAPMKSSLANPKPADGEEPPTKAAGAYGEKTLYGSSGIMLWGPYEELAPGEYVVVYRFQVLKAPTKPEATLFFDVCHNACTTSGTKIKTSTFPVGSWCEVTVPVSIPVSKKVEFRFWPDGAETAMDRVYLFSVKLAGESPVMSKSADDSILPGLAIEGRPNVLRSPHGNDSGMIDVSGFSSGTKLRCPYSGKFFRIP